MSKRSLATLFCIAATCGSAEAAILTHDYQLNGSLADALGGPALVSHGGSLGASDYSFDVNQGLTLSNGFTDAADYSIELAFSFSNTSGYDKIIDFKDRTSDTGFYTLNSALNFYPVATGPAATIPGETPVNVILTRDGASGTTRGYVNGALQWSFLDSSSYGVFSGLDNIAHFFRDDFATGQAEAAAGSVDFIRIYQGAISGVDAQCLQSNTPGSCNILSLGNNNNVPLPGTLALLGAGLLPLALRRRAAR